jgi:hypothetical protein
VQNRTTAITHIDIFVIIFNKPTRYTRPTINSFGQTIPPYEFYLNSDRGIVLMFKGTLSIAEFELNFPRQA